MKIMTWMLQGVLHHRAGGVQHRSVHLRLRRLQLRQPELDVCDGGSVLGGAGLPAALEAHSQDGAAETLATLA